jgi:lipopolysaccharide export system permease protein
MKITLVDRYLFKEIGQTWLAVTAVLLLILLGNTLAVVLSRAAEGGLPIAAVLPLFATKMVSFLVTLIPLGLYLGIMLGLGRLYKDSEMSALAACGIGTLQIYRPVLACGFAAVILIASLTTWVSPWAARIDQQLKEQIAARSELSAIGAGQFNESKDGKLVLFTRASSRDGRRLEDVFVHGWDSQGRNAIEVAKFAEQRLSGDDSPRALVQSGDRFIILNQGKRYVGQPGEANYEIISFDRHGVRLEGQNATQGRQRRAAKPTWELVNSDDIGDTAELHYRLSLPVASLLLAMMAVPLSRTSPRKGRYARLVVAILIYIPYSNLIVVSKNWLEDGITPPALGMWWVHAIAVILTVFLLFRLSGRTWMGRLRAQRVR